MPPLAAYTDATRQALEQVRDPGNMAWYVVTFIGIVMYVYAVEVERRRWDVIAAGLAFFFMDIFNELVNSAWLHVSGTSALWTVTGPTAFQPLVGWTVEIAFLFAISGIEFVKWLPQDRRRRILGINNRVLYVVGFSALCVFVEVLLMRAGIFHWHWPYWSESFPLTILVFGYATFFALAAIVFDMDSHRRRFAVVGTLIGIDSVLGVCLGLTGWL